MVNANNLKITTTKHQFLIPFHLEEEHKQSSWFRGTSTLQKKSILTVTNTQILAAT